MTVMIYSFFYYRVKFCISHPRSTLVPVHNLPTLPPWFFSLQPILLSCFFEVRWSPRSYSIHFCVIWPLRSHILYFSLQFRAALQKMQLKVKRFQLGRKCHFCSHVFWWSPLDQEKQGTYYIHRRNCRILLPGFFLLVLGLCVVFD